MKPNELAFLPLLAGCPRGLAFGDVVWSGGDLNRCLVRGESGWGCLTGRLGGGGDALLFR